MCKCIIAKSVSLCNNVGIVWQANVEFIGSAVAKMTTTELLQLKVSVKDNLFRLAKVDLSSYQ